VGGCQEARALRGEVVIYLLISSQTTSATLKVNLLKTFKKVISKELSMVVNNFNHKSLSFPFQLTIVL